MTWTSFSVRWVVEEMCRMILIKLQQRFYIQVVLFLLSLICSANQMHCQKRAFVAICLRCNFLNITLDLRLEIQPALKLSWVSGTLGAVAKVIYLNYYHDEPVWPWKGKRNIFLKTLVFKKNCILKCTASTSLPYTNAPIRSMSIEIHGKFLLGRLFLSYYINISTWIIVTTWICVTFGGDYGLIKIKVLPCLLTLFFVGSFLRL